MLLPQDTLLSKWMTFQQIESKQALLLGDGAIKKGDNSR